jgi:putative ubiquitin-RnfH superfamily antitoxin RatB of RatAB toxin-antitoxin module
MLTHAGTTEPPERGCYRDDKGNLMNVGVTYSNNENQVWLRLEVPEGSTVEDAIKQSGLLKRFPELNLETQKVGIFGKIVKLNTPLKDSDRVEIYRPIIADPKTVPRRFGDDDDDD